MPRKSYEKDYQRALGRTAYTLREIKALGDLLRARGIQTKDWWARWKVESTLAVAMQIATNLATAQLAALADEFDVEGGSSDEQLAARALELMSAARDELAKQYPDHDWNFIVGAPPSQPAPPPFAPPLTDFWSPRRLIKFVVDARIGADASTLTEPPPVTFKLDRRLTKFVVDARRVGP